MPVLKPCTTHVDTGAGLVLMLPHPRWSCFAQGVDLALGVRSLLATALYPGGEMPYNRQRELEVFLATMLRMALKGGDDLDSADEALRLRLRSLQGGIGMSEQAVIRMFHEVLEEWLPAGRPYVT
jgi:hypothetical protein